MAETSTHIDARHFDYIAERTVQDDAFLLAMKEAAQAAGIPSISICSAQASFQQILLRLHGARRVVEVGTLAGYSAITMARALPAGSELHTIEIEPRYADFAAEWISRSEVADTITLHRGDGREVLPSFEAGSLDAAFFDADKASYGVYVDAGQRLLRSGGLLMVDNAFAFGQLFEEQPTDPEAPAVQVFNEEMGRLKGFQKVIVPLGDGLWVAIKD